MLGIYADTFRTATRTHRIEVHEVPPKNPGARRRWRFGRKKVLIDLSRL